MQYFKIITTMAQNIQGVSLVTVISRRRGGSKKPHG